MLSVRLEVSFPASERPALGQYQFIVLGEQGSGTCVLNLPKVAA